MKFSLDSQTILYVVIGLFFVQLFIMRYYVGSSIEESHHRNNKKLIKKISTQIDSTFDRYMGNRSEQTQLYSHQNRTERQEYNDIDSINDPAEDIDREESEEIIEDEIDDIEGNYE